MSAKKPSDDPTLNVERPAEAGDPVGPTLIQPTLSQTAPPADATSIVDPDLTLRQESIGLAGRTEIAAGMPAVTGGGRYRLLQLHARGGLGAVYVAEDTELRRRVALKEIQVQHAHDERSRQRFVIEAEITGRLAHPGIVPVHGLGQYSDGRPFYAMRFVEGETLLDAILRYHRGEPSDRSLRRLALRQLLKHFLDVCNAVAYAHNQGVIHRDLKPSNILLGKFGETILVDWGLAKYLGVCQAESATRSRDPDVVPEPLSEDWTLLANAATQMGAAIGTPAYMSPEQAAGRWNDVGIASDVYSLGASLYTLLTGAAPMPKPDQAGDWLTVPLGGVKSPCDLVPDTPPGLAAVCRKAMQERPAERYASALPLAEDVEHWLGDEPVSALPEGFMTWAGRWARRHLALVSGVTAAVLVTGLSLAAGVALLAHSNQRLRDANRQTLQAVDDFFTDVSENPRLLRKEPGTQALRKALLERARDYYEGFLRERGDDASLQTEAAAAYFRLALIQEQLDPGPKVLELYRHAATMRAALAAAAPDDPARAFDLAQTRNHVGKMLQDMGKSGEALAEFETARASLAQLAPAHPDRPRYAKELARILDNSGVVLHTIGRGPEALDACSQARAILERLVREYPADAEIAREYSIALGILGALQRLGGDAGAAIETLKAAGVILDRLARAHPDRTEFVQDLAQTANLLAIALTQANRKDEALAAYQQSLESRERLARENPGVAEYAQELAVTCNNIGTLLRALGRVPDALNSCLKALELQKKLAADHPELVEFRQDLARTHNNLGILYTDQFQRDEAREEYRKAKSIQEHLARTQPHNIELGQELAKCCHNLGRLLIALGRFDEARTALDQARTIRVKVPGAVAELVETDLARADLELQCGQFGESLAACNQALDGAATLSSPAAAPLRRAALRVRAMSLSRLGRHGDALTAWDEALALADPAERLLLQLGRAAAQIRAGNLDGLTTAQAAVSEHSAGAILFESARIFTLAKTDEHLATALALLRRAAAGGWFRDPQRLTALQADQDFADLRKRPEFTTWLAEIQPK